MWLAVQMASRKYSSSERTDELSRRRGNGAGGMASEESRDSVRGRDMSYNFLQLTNSASDDNLSQAASAAAENVAAQGFQPLQVQEQGVNSGDVSMQIVHEESL